MARRVLLAFWEGGNGHLRRVVALSELLQSRGVEVAFLASGAGTGSLVGLKPDATVYTVDRNFVPEPGTEERPRYSHAFRHDQRRRALGYSAQAITTEVVAIRGVFRRFLPDLVVNDYHDSIRIAADADEIPIVSLVMATGLPGEPPMGYWKLDEVGDRAMPSCLDAFNDARTLLGLSPYRDERDTFVGLANFIPSCPSLDPVRTVVGEHRVHVSAIAGPASPQEHDARSRPVVVSYRAEGNRRPDDGYQRTLFEVVKSFGARVDFRVFGSNRYEAVFGRPRRASPFRGFVSVEEFDESLADASVVVTSGGATMTHALSVGVPVVCVPWTASEATHGMRAAEANAGLLPAEFLSPLEWRFDTAVGAEVAGLWGETIGAKRLEALITEALDDPKYRVGAMDVASELATARRALPSELERLGV